MLDLSNFLPVINIAGFVIVGCIFWFKEYKTGSAELSKEVSENYKTLDAQQKEQITQLRTDVSEIRATMRANDKVSNERITALETQVKEKDNYIKQMQDILSNRNPELVIILNEIKLFMKEIRDANTHQTDILEGQVIRERKVDQRTENIDKHTAQEDGKVLRK